MLGIMLGHEEGEELKMNRIYSFLLWNSQSYIWLTQRRAYMSFCTIVCTGQKLVSLNLNALQLLVQIREEHFAAGELPCK